MLWAWALAQQKTESPVTTNATSTVHPTGVPAHVTLLESFVRAVISFKSPEDYFFAALVISCLLLLGPALEQAKKQEEKVQEKEALELAYRVCWQTGRWPAFAALSEMWTRREPPWGPWDASSIQERWPDKRYMRRFCRAGIVPFNIQPGGVRTYQKSKFKAHGWAFDLPVYVQSKGRAYFEFMILFPYGFDMNAIPERDQPRADFVKELLDQEDYAVEMWFENTAQGREKYKRHQDEVEYSPLRVSGDYLECGAESWFKFLLPFKSDKILTKGKAGEDTWLRDFIEDVDAEAPLLTGKPVALVRIETLDYDPVRLDEYVYDCARRAGLQDIYIEDGLSRELGRLYASVGLDPQ